MDLFLYVAHYDPSIDMNGAKIRLAAMANEFINTGRRFIFVRSTDKMMWEAKNFGRFVPIGIFKENEKFRSSEVRAIIFSWFWLAQHSEGIMSHLRLNNPRVPIVLDTIDAVGLRLHREYLATRMQTPTAVFSVQHERMQLDKADFIIAITPEEVKHFRTLTHTPSMEVGFANPQRVGPRLDRLTADERANVTGFFGSRNYANLHSLVRACQIAWRSGRIRRFIVVGSVCDYSDSVIKLKSLFGDWLSVMGRVDDPWEFYRQVEFTTNTLVFGSGIKIKMVETLGYGVPTVANAIALEGLPRTLPGLYFADTHIEFSERMDDIRDHFTRCDDTFFARAFRSQVRKFAEVF